MTFKQVLKEASIGFEGSITLNDEESKFSDRTKDQRQDDNREQAPLMDRK